MKIVKEVKRFCNNLTADDCYSYGKIPPFNMLRDWLLEVFLVRAKIKKHDSDELFSKLDNLRLLKTISEDSAEI